MLRQLVMELLKSAKLTDLQVDSHDVPTKIQEDLLSVATKILGLSCSPLEWKSHVEVIGNTIRILGEDICEVSH